MISSFELFSIGYYSAVDKCKVPMHCTQSNVSNLFTFPAVTKKLRYHGASKEIVNPYQKPQRLMNEILELFSSENDWVLDLFSGSGTTTVCALKKGRNAIAIEKDPLQAAFILQRVCAVDDLPDADQEVGAKFIEQNELFGVAGLEPQPPLTDELGGLAEIEDEGMEEPSSPSVSKSPSPVREPEEILDV